VGYGFVSGEERAYLLSFPFRVFEMNPVGDYWTNIYMNVSNQLITQVVFQAKGYILDWSTCRVADASNFIYTVERRDPGQDQDWFPALPTGDWPCIQTVWTNWMDLNQCTEYFRIKAEPEM
jgi:hypothetical protein